MGGRPQKLEMQSGISHASFVVSRACDNNKSQGRGTERLRPETKFKPARLPTREEAVEKNDQHQRAYGCVELVFDEREADDAE